MASQTKSVQLHKGVIMLVSVGQVQVIINEAGAQVDFPIGEAKFSINVTKMPNNNLWTTLSVGGRKLYQGTVKVAKDDAQTS